jgi:hypothetical protein
MGTKALLIHPSHQGVCWRHDTEDSCVTPGDLHWSQASWVSDPISQKAKWEAMLMQESENVIVPKARDEQLV